MMFSVENNLQVAQVLYVTIIYFIARSINIFFTHFYITIKFLGKNEAEKKKKQY